VNPNVKLELTVTSAEPINGIPAVVVTSTPTYNMKIILKKYSQPDLYPLIKSIVSLIHVCSLNKSEKSFVHIIAPSYALM